MECATGISEPGAHTTGTSKPGAALRVICAHQAVFYSPGGSPISRRYSGLSFSVLIAQALCLAVFGEGQLNQVR
jgi:hypothetical protein